MNGTKNGKVTEILKVNNSSNVTLSFNVTDFAKNMIHTVNLTEIVKASDSAKVTYSVQVTYSVLR